MTSTEKAKRFLQNKARTLALAAVPLAALVAITPHTAKAGALTFDGCSGAGNGINATYACSGSLLPTQSNGSNGGTFSGTESINPFSGSGSSFSVRLGWWGSFSGSGSFSFPVAWDFTVDSTSTNPYTWALDFDFPDGTVVTEETGGGTGNQIFTGTDTVNFSGAPGSYSAYLVVNGTASSPTDILSLNVPSLSSVDINNESPSTSTPEPASLFLAVPALGLMLFKRRRKA